VRLICTTLQKETGRQLRLVEASRYRTPFHTANFTARRSLATSDVVPKCIVGLRAESYFQPQPPVVANATQAACIALVSDCGGSRPSIGSVTPRHHFYGYYPPYNRYHFGSASHPPVLAGNRLSIGAGCEVQWRSFPPRPVHLFGASPSAPGVASALGRPSISAIAKKAHRRARIRTTSTSLPTGLDLRSHISVASPWLTSPTTLGALKPCADESVAALRSDDPSRRVRELAFTSDWPTARGGGGSRSKLKTADPERKVEPCLGLHRQRLQDKRALEAAY
jgi:hypothetical protein